jgi:hypothetical protein
MIHCWLIPMTTAKKKMHSNARRIKNRFRIRGLLVV